MPEPVNVLLVEDSPSDARLLQESLGHYDIQGFTITHVERLEEGLRLLREARFDALLLDLSLPDSSGPQTFQRVLAAAPEVPVVVLTGTDDATVAEEAVRLGVQDYLTKSEADGRSIARSIRYAVERKRAELALQRANDQLERRVEERTAELTRAVEALEEEVQRRGSAEERLREVNQKLEQRSGQLRALASELTLVEQRERRRMAQVLHDDLQQLMVGVRFRITPLQRSAEESVRLIAREVDQLMAQAIETSRTLIGELSPSILHEAGLVSALEWLAHWMQTRHGLKVKIEVEAGVPEQGEDVRMLLFQSVRELLFNVAKHSRVQEAQVRVRPVDDRVWITVSDQGVGCDPTLLANGGSRSGGFGLFSIRERLDQLGGGLEIASAPGQGTCVTLMAPASRPSAGERPAGGSAPSQPGRALASKSGQRRNRRSR